ncbi:hypothetical protein EVAR_95510_1 [Eumeta japonica]|uniref:Uncharacterized protein n=1 Tax=Eumeta variegata TaxID=151549 RepID=A0A4C1UJ38_EUMVA|nr:hypothetical protein EVAR_95510_1 [Eumeta japonica]
MRVKLRGAASRVIKTAPVREHTSAIYDFTLKTPFSVVAYTAAAEKQQAVSGVGGCISENSFPGLCEALGKGVGDWGEEDSAE